MNKLFLLFLFFVSCVLFLLSCNSTYTAGKKKGFFKIDFPEKKYQTFDQPALVLKPSGAGQAQFGTCHSDDDRAPRRGRLRRNLLDLVSLDDVVLLHVVEPFEPDSALEPRFHFTYIVLEPSQ